jgi:hypothetical protein
MSICACSLLNDTWRSLSVCALTTLIAASSMQDLTCNHFHVERWRKRDKVLVHSLERVGSCINWYSRHSLMDSSLKSCIRVQECIVQQFTGVHPLLLPILFVRSKLAWKPSPILGVFETCSRDVFNVSSNFLEYLAKCQTQRST